MKGNTYEKTFTFQLGLVQDVSEAGAPCQEQFISPFTSVSTILFSYSPKRRQFSNYESLFSKVA